MNAYLKEISGEDYTSKDFRTWAGTVHAADVLRACGPFRSATEAKRNVVRAVESVAKPSGEHEGGVTQVLHPPAVVEAYSDGSMTKIVLQRAKRARAANGLDEEELRVLSLLQRKLNGKRKAS